jgi:hypothetical protein
MVVQGTYIFATADEGKPIVVTYTTQSLTGYTPNLAAAYALTDLDFIDEKGNKDPVQVERADIYSLPTIQRIEVSSRYNQYAATPVEARDQSQIEVFGPRVASTIQAHEICDEFIVGPLVAQTILQRELYVRTKFTFKLSWEYCLLDPMDIVTITDSNLGLSNYPVRIISIEEDDKGLLAVTAEELVAGVSTPAYYPSASPGNFAPNWAVPATPVNTPLICEPPLTATGGVAQVWVGGVRRCLWVLDPMGRRERLRLGRQRHLFADRRHNVALAPRRLDRGAAGGGRMGLDRHAGGQHGR